MFTPAGCHGWFFDLIADGMSGPVFSFDPDSRAAVYQYLQSHAPGVFDHNEDMLTLYDKSRYLSRRTFNSWRDILKTNQIQIADSSWRNMLDYRHFDDYDCDYFQNIYQEAWEVDYLRSIGQYEIPEDREHRSSSGESSL